jgi:hypothetical protein
MKSSLRQSATPQHRSRPRGNDRPRPKTPLLAVLDRRWIGRPLFGVLMVAGIAGGLIITRVSPFSFGGGDHYMEGVIVSAGSTLALVGYVFAIIWQFARQRLGHDRP